MINQHAHFQEQQRQALAEHNQRPTFKDVSTRGLSTVAGNSKGGADADILDVQPGGGVCEGTGRQEGHEKAVMDPEPVLMVVASDMVEARKIEKGQGKGEGLEGRTIGEGGGEREGGHGGDRGGERDGGEGEGSAKSRAPEKEDREALLQVPAAGPPGRRNDARPRARASKHHDASMHSTSEARKPQCAHLRL